MSGPDDLELKATVVSAAVGVGGLNTVGGDLVEPPEFSIHGQTAGKQGSGIVLLWILIEICLVEVTSKVIDNKN